MQDLKWEIRSTGNTHGLSPEAVWAGFLGRFLVYRWCFGGPLNECRTLVVMFTTSCVWSFPSSGLADYNWLIVGGLDEEGSSPGGVPFITTPVEQK